MNVLGGQISRNQPLYILIAQRLIEAIEAGEFAIGDLLPTEMELAAQYGVSRHTMREAVRELISRGMVSRRQDVGTRVTAIHPRGEFSQVLDSIDDLLQFAASTRLANMTPSAVLAEEPIIGPRKFQAGQKLMRIDATRVSRDAVASPPIAWTKITSSTLTPVSRKIWKPMKCPSVNLSNGGTARSSRKFSKHRPLWYWTNAWQTF